VLRGRKLRDCLAADQEGFITLAGFRDLKARIPAGKNAARKINLISLDEIGIALLAVAEQGIGFTPEGLITAAAKALGYSRKSEQIVVRMNAALRRLIEQGHITLIDEKIRVNGENDHG
jgi:hypothetical protein